MQRITPHLWFDKEAKEAAGFYASLFPNSRITHVTTLHNTPSGDCDVVSFELAGQPFMAISAGPLFKRNPSVLFMLNARRRAKSMWYGKNCLGAGTSGCLLAAIPSVNGMAGWKTVTEFPGS